MADEKQEIREWLDFLPKLVISFIAVNYVIGFIIVNVHLSRFGIIDLEVIKSKYLAAGLLYCFYVSLTAGWTLLVIYKFFSGGRSLPVIKDMLKSWRGRVLLFGLFVFLLLAYSIFPLVMLYPLTDLSSFLSSLVEYYACTFFSACLFAFLAWFSFSPDAARPLYARIMQIFVTIFLSTIMFTNYVYPTLPARYMGGRLLQVQVRHKEGTSQTSLSNVLNALPLETCLVSQNTERVILYMALDGDKEIYDATVSLSYTAVESITFLGESRRRVTALKSKRARARNIFQIAYIFADVFDNIETPKQKEVLRNKLKRIHLKGEELDFFVNLFQEVTREVKKS